MRGRTMTATIETYARPTVLYRYRSFDVGTLEDSGNSAANNKNLQREIEALLEGYIFCAPYNEMNDPMEGLYRSSRKASQHPEYHRFIEQLLKEKIYLGIASFSETWDNVLMWAHYADAFQGICICYSMPKLLGDLSSEHTFSRVAYSNKPYYLNLPALKNDELARAVLSTKHLDWSYEREWRLFAPQKGKACHGRDAILSIYLGARVPKNVRNEITGRLVNVQIYTTKVDDYTITKKRNPRVRPVIMQSVKRRGERRP